MTTHQKDDFAHTRAGKREPPEKKLPKQEILQIPFAR